MNLRRMFEMQAYLDDHIRRVRGLEGENLIPKKVLALQVEIAELAQEISDCWKYWKTPKARNRSRVLEELVDVLHFILSLGLEIYPDPPVIRPRMVRRMDLVDQLNDMIKLAAAEHHAEWYFLFGMFLGLCDMLGFTWDEVERAYIAKNEKNMARQAQGY